MDDRIIWAVLAVIALLVGSLSVVADMNSTYKVDQAYETYINTPIVRNEWGQQRMTQEQMCSATIKQWMEVCDE